MIIYVRTFFKCVLAINTAQYSYNVVSMASVILHHTLVMMHVWCYFITYLQDRVYYMLHRTTLVTSRLPRNTECCVFDIISITSLFLCVYLMSLLLNIQDHTNVVFLIKARVTYCYTCLMLFHKTLKIM